MPRKRRIALPGEIHHVMSRGIDGADIFHDSSDKKKFLHMLGKVLSFSSCRCYAWALMPNHYHLLLRPMGEKLGKIMLRLNGGYARFYNKRHGRRGYLFQDRFKSVVIQEFLWFKELVGYIHLNPLRGKVVKTMNQLDSYKWCGHHIMLGKGVAPWHSADEALARFGETRQAARTAYRRFLLAKLKADTNVVDCESLLQLKEILSRENDNTAIITSDERLAGDSDFVKKAVAKAECDEIELRQQKLIRISLDNIRQQIAEKFGIGPGQLFNRARRNSRSDARISFCHIAQAKYGYSSKEIAAFLGVSSQAVSNAITKAMKANPAD